jgi:metallo-beta-lactamase class B
VKTVWTGLGAVIVAAIASAPTGFGQASDPQLQAHLAAAKAAAGKDHEWMYNRLCVQALGDMGKPPAAASARGAQPSGPPPRSSWHAEPVKVFDNLYRVGSIQHSGWAITTSDGIILMDALYDYNVRDSVVEGLKKLGLNPASIKYAIIGHAHGDHVGGAKALQELYGTKIVLSADDWNLLERTGASAGSAANMPKPKRDVVATDGMKITVGDTTVTVYVTPGHTQGTISSIIPLRDQGKPHVAAYWGGTMFNWIGGSPQYITPRTPFKYWFNTYADSAARFRDIAAKAGADVILSNHTDFDGSKVKEPLLAKRKPGDPHPYVIGQKSVQGYLTTVGECSRAGALVAK